MAGILYTPTGLLDPVGPPKDETVAIVAVDEHESKLRMAVDGRSADDRGRLA